MGFWDRLRQTLAGGGVPEAASPAAEPPGPIDRLARTDEADAPIASARAQRFAERLLDDEGLGANLSADQFQPLLDWGLGVLDRAAAETAGQSRTLADRRLEAVAGQVREALRTVDGLATLGATADSGRLERVIEGLVGARDAGEGLAVARRAVRGGPGGATDGDIG